MAIILWFLAAMSLLIGGLAMQARMDIRLTQLHAERARAEAAADGAIQVALAQMILEEVEQNLDNSLPFNFSYGTGINPVRVQLIPLTGLVDLNQAHEELLRRIFASVPGLVEEEALALAAAVIEWRSASAGVWEAASERSDAAPSADHREMRHARFESIEDLLLVPGVDRRIFEVLRELVYVSQSGQSGVDWRAAPIGVLQAVGEITREQAQEIAQSSTSGAAVPVEWNMAFQQSENLSFYRADAVITTHGQTFLRRRWVERDASGTDRLPWRFFHSEPLRAVAGLGNLSWHEVVDAKL